MYMYIVRHSQRKLLLYNNLPAVKILNEKYVGMVAPTLRNSKKIMYKIMYGDI
jgi:hypothetical protein